MRGLDRRDDALGAAQQRERVHRLGVRDRAVLGPSDVVEERVFRPHAGVVEAGRDRMRLDGLTVVVLQQVGVRAVQRARRSARDRRCMTSGLHTVTACLESDQLHGRVVDEGVEDADRVGAAADARGDGVRQPAGQRAHLCAGLEADDALEVADHRRERMRARRSAEAVVRVVRVGDPVAQRLVDRVLEGRRSGDRGDDLAAEEAHPCDVERLPLGVHLTHVDDALESEECARRRGRDAMLAGAGLRDHAGLAHPLGEQHLPEHIVDLVRAGVVEVFALEEQASTAGVLGQPGRFVDRRRPAGVVPLQAIQFAQERRIDAGLVVLGGDFLDHRHQCLGDVAATVGAEVATRIGFVGASRGDAVAHAGQALVRAGETLGGKYGIVCSHLFSLP
ncbi:conserved hypothetical protein [Rhodococcus sp. RD6.2]|nr:conserved hypothetical protein [Rhodococcus sp. RD6.2]